VDRGVVVRRRAVGCAPGDVDDRERLTRRRVHPPDVEADLVEHGDPCIPEGRQLRRSPAGQAILAATRTLLEHKPPGEVSMDAVAAEAGFSRQAIYRHFGSRAGLLSEVLASIDVAEGAPQAVDRVLAAEPGSASIDALLEWRVAPWQRSATDRSAHTTRSVRRADNRPPRSRHPDRRPVRSACGSTKVHDH
jgi:hypothetical protein